MSNLSYTERKKHISILLKNMGNVLGIDVTTLNPIKERLELIILNNNTLEDMFTNYFNLLESEMVTLILQNITPAFQFGIKNRYFSFIGYTGQLKATTLSPNINEHTFFSFDSISKILTSVITMIMIRDGKVTLKTPVNSFNPAFNMDASIESIIKFTANIKTDERIDKLPIDKTIEILKKCRNNIISEFNSKPFYQYNDIGYMILRLSIPDFLERLDTVLGLIDENNLTYKNKEHKSQITGGRLGFEYMTPDTKGRGIPFPGHTGLYGNIEGLLNLFNKIFYTTDILTPLELETLLKVPYQNIPSYPKVGGIYRTPTNILESKIDKMATCDFSNLTTSRAMASAGTCGSWVMGDDLSYQNQFGTYVGGILTNPYSYINVGTYPHEQNQIPNTNLIVNQKGIIIGYPKMLNTYKEIVAEYGILLLLLTEYIKNTYGEKIINKKHTTYVRALKRS